MKHILIGTITLEKDVVMYNMQFQYAASFEQLNVPAGEYPVYAREDGLQTRQGRTEVKDGYIGFEGTVLAGNVGGKPGEHSHYNQMWYGYNMAECFLNGHDYNDNVRYDVRRDWVLRPEWGLEITDINSCIDGRRLFSLNIALKDGAEVTYMD